MKFFSLFAQYRVASVGLRFLAVMIAMALTSPLYFPNSPFRMVQSPFLTPLEVDGFPMGTDTMGRNVAAGLMHGAWVSLLIGLVSTSVALVIGVPLGALPGD